MPFPQVVAVAARSAADLAGVMVGDEVRSLNGVVPRDVIEWQFLADEAEIELDIDRGGVELALVASKRAGEPLGVEVSSPLFDRVRTCDNHCEFCFIYQLPKGMRRSLYVKDDDYRLSFLYGNFTTLTRFTELDLERVVTERLSPLYVSIHATDPEVRARMLRNPRGAMSLRWLRQLLDHGIEVHGQIVVCPDVNDKAVLEDTLAGIAETYPDLASAAAVPLGTSRFSKEAQMRPHRPDEAAAVLDTVERWQELFLAAIGRRMVFAADEYYLLAGRPFPSLESYEGLPQLENGIGIARSFEVGLFGRATPPTGHRGGFFASIDGAPQSGYRARRDIGDHLGTSGSGQTFILTGRYGAAVLGPLLSDAGFGDVDIVAVENEYFGGNIGVAGLLTGIDLARTLETLPADGRFLIPDVCLSEGRFLDGLAVGDLPRNVEIVEANGTALRRVLGRKKSLAVSGATGSPR